MKSWKDREPEDLLTKQYPTGETLFDAYCIILRANYLREQWPAHAGPSLEEWKAQYLDIASSTTSNGTSDSKPTYNADILCCLELICGRTIFEAADGYIGIGPPTAKPGDAICVLLGCKTPMVLRPLAHVSPEAFTVVGDCYVHGLDDAIVLLGPLPLDWRLRCSKITSGYAAAHTFTYSRTKKPVEEDPRLLALPTGWTKATRAREPDDPSLFQCFRNGVTGEEINYDP